MRTTRLLVVSFVMILLAGSFKPASHKLSQTFAVEVDSLSCQLTEVMDAGNRVMYYYTNIDRFPCEDSVCYRMSLRMYWDGFGNFLKISYLPGNELTKINHVPFNNRDYKRLHRLLNNPDAFIRYYKLDALTEHQSEMTYYSVDAVTSATVSDVNIVYECVKGAVKTCYTLWHIAHGMMPEFIREKNRTAEHIVSAPFDNCMEAIESEELEKIVESFQHLPQPSADNFVDYSTLLDTLRKENCLPENALEALSRKLSTENDYAIIIYNFLLLEDYWARPVRKYKPMVEENK